MVFATLAITFLLDIDDQLMCTFCERFHLGRAHREINARLRRAIAERVCIRLESEDEPGSERLSQAADSIRLWAFVLVTALSGLHLYQTLEYATMIGVAGDDQADTEDSIRSYFSTLQASARARACRWLGVRAQPACA